MNTPTARLLNLFSILALLGGICLLFLTVQPSDGWNALRASASQELQNAQTQALERFKSDNMATQKSDAADTAAVSRAQVAANEEINQAMNAANLRWQAQVQALGHSQNLAQLRLAIGWTLLTTGASLLALRLIQVPRLRTV